MIWKVRGQSLDLTHRALLMGIVNVTPDSFSDGGSFLDPLAACTHGLKLVEEGADILDIGGESTRPGSQSVPLEEEIQRVIPVIERLRQETKALISIDTNKAAVAQAAMDAGADIINDITGLRGDANMPSVVSQSGAGVIIMHMKGTPRTMQDAPAYQDIMSEIGDFFRQSVALALSSGIDPMSIALDPGIGFGKTPEHNRQLLVEIGSFAKTGHPILVGASRKSFLGWLAGSTAMEDRFWPGVATTSLCRERGARIFRVHDVKPHHDALRMTEAILNHV
ncbi:MAG: dihydropteroate synthase [Verrucomicrobia bacterium]|nr:dihydropteroate synthase [Verrucomicrobiota bacterium]